MILGQSFMGEKFVWWVGGLEGKFSVSFGPTYQDLSFGFGPSCTIEEKHYFILLCMR